MLQIGSETKRAARSSITVFIMLEDQETALLHHLFLFSACTFLNGNELTFLSFPVLDFLTSFPNNKTHDPQEPNKANIIPIALSPITHDAQPMPERKKTVEMMVGVRKGASTAAGVSTDKSKREEVRGIAPVCKTKRTAKAMNEIPTKLAKYCSRPFN